MKLFSLALAGFVVLVTASPVETIAVAASKYKNDGVHTYKCDSKTNVLSCVSSSICSFVEHCSTKCFTNRQYAGCTGSATAAVEAPEKRDTDTEVDAEDKKTYECSNDHTGVLVCQYGFCQTDHYCKKGTKCRDRCSCCRNMTVFEREVDALDTTKISQPESNVAEDVQALAVVESNTLASRANDPPQDGLCAPGTYTCFLSPSTGTAWIMVCGWDGKYQYSSDCGNSKCLEDAAGVAHCWNPGKEWDSNSALVSRRDELDPVPSDLAPNPNCNPGEFGCTWNDATKTERILVCDQSGHNWQWSADCGKGMKCVQGGGVAHCVAQQALFEAWETAQNLDLVTRQDPNACSHPGEVACNDYTVVRCDNGHWTEVQNCGPDLVCAIDQDRVPHCIRPMTIAASTLATVVVGAAASAKA